MYLDFEIKFSMFWIFIWLIKPSLSSSIWLKLGILGAFMSGKWFSYWGAGVNGACGDGVPVGKNIIIKSFFKFVSKFMFENYT